MATVVGFLVSLFYLGYCVSVTVSKSGVDSTTCTNCLTISTATQNCFGGGKTSANVFMTLGIGRYEELKINDISGSLKITGQDQAGCIILGPPNTTFFYIRKNSNLSLVNLTALIAGVNEQYLISSYANTSIILSYCTLSRTGTIWGLSINLGTDTYLFAMDNCNVYGIDTLYDDSLLYTSRINNMLFTNTSFTNFSCPITYLDMEVVDSFNVSGCVVANWQNISREYFIFEVRMFNSRNVIQSSVFLNVSDAIYVHPKDSSSGEITISNVSFTNSIHRMIRGWGPNATSRILKCNFENITKYYYGAIWISKSVAYIERCVFKKCERAVYGNASSLEVIESIFIDNYYDGLGDDVYANASNITLVDCYTDLTVYYPTYADRGGIIIGALVKAVDLCQTDPVTPTAKTAFTVFCTSNDTSQAKGSAGGDNKIPMAALISIIVVGVVVVVVGATVLVLAQRKCKKRKDDSSTELTLEAEQGASESM